MYSGDSTKIELAGPVQDKKGRSTLYRRTLLFVSRGATPRAVASDAPGGRDRDLCRTGMAPSHALSMDPGSGP